MERIKEAIKLAKSQQDSARPMVVDRRLAEAPAMTGAMPAGAEPPAATALPSTRVLRVNRDHLEMNRIVAHMSGNPVNVPYDILRTKVTQEMDQKGWKVLIVTSPTANCGKTVTSINLSLSIAKLSGRSVVLVDLDLRKPSIARTLGLTLEKDLSSFLAGTATPDDIMVQIDLAGPQLAIVGNMKAVNNPSEALGSGLMAALFDYLRAQPDRPIIIVDMPPVLFSDDVLSFMPLSDCCLLTVQEKVTTVREIESSEELLQATNMLGCVLNKSNEGSETYYY